MSSLSASVRLLRPILEEHDPDHDHRADCDHHRADHRQLFEHGDNARPPAKSSRETPACHTHSETPFGPQQQRLTLSTQSARLTIAHSGVPLDQGEETLLVQRRVTHAVPIDRRGRRTPLTLLHLSVRDHFLRAAADIYCTGMSDRTAAAWLHKKLARYRECAWRRDRVEEQCPPRLVGRVNGLMWCVLKCCGPGRELADNQAQAVVLFMAQKPVDHDCSAIIAIGGNT